MLALSAGGGRVRCRKIAGVTGQVKQIQLKPVRLPADVLASVMQTFARGGLDAGDRIAVDVRANEITLRGYVHSPDERDIAATATWSVPGVTKVENTVGVY